MRRGGRGTERSRGPSPAPSRQGGQATAELALVLPLVVMLLVFLIEAGLVVRDQVLVIHAAREAARAAAVDADHAAVQAAAAEGSGLEGLRVELSGRNGPGSRVSVRVSYDEPGRFPFVRTLTSRLTLTASATMRVEEEPTSTSGPQRA